MNRRSKKIKLLAISIVNAIVLLLVCYFADNWKFSILTGPSVGQRIEQVKEVLGWGEDRMPEDYVFINTAYDRELVRVVDEYGFPEGEIDITDRKKLAEFLSQLDSRHKYVMMDVLLSDRFKSESDSLLVAEILNTERICIARSSTAQLLDQRLIPNSGYTDYATHIYETNFVKYEFLNEGSETLPYKVFLHERPEDHLTSFGPFHFLNGRLSWKSLTLRFPIKLWNDTKAQVEDDLQEKVILNLGADILNMGVDVPSLVKDKIVVIGDYREDDIHDTYLGKISGPVINVNALEALRNNELEIPWWLIITLIIFYTGFSLLLLTPDSYSLKFNRKMIRIIPKSKFIRYLLSFIGYTVIFTIFAIIIYLSSGIDINVFIPSIWFTALSAIIKYRRGRFDKYKLSL